MAFCLCASLAKKRQLFQNMFQKIGISREDLSALQMSVTCFHLCVRFVLLLNNYFAVRHQSYNFNICLYATRECAIFNQSRAGFFFHQNVGQR